MTTGRPLGALVADLDRPRERQTLHGDHAALERDRREADRHHDLVARFALWTPPAPDPPVRSPPRPRRSSREARLSSWCPPIPPGWPWPRSGAADIVAHLRAEIVALRAALARLQKSGGEIPQNAKRMAGRRT